MFLEIFTFLMMILVLALKYGTVTRIVKLNQRLREAEVRRRRNEEHLKMLQSERRVVEREENGLVRKQISLEDDLKRVGEELDTLKEFNMEVLQALAEKKGGLDLVGGTE